MDNKLEQDITYIGESLVEAVRAAIRRVDAFATGELYDSIEFVIGQENGLPSVTIQAVDYWMWSNYGREAGKPPPVNPLIIWIEARGLDMNPFALAYSIGKNGTDGKKWLSEVDFNVYNRKVLEAYKAYVGRIIKANMKSKRVRSYPRN